jgi:hypothetical protein
MLFKLKRLLRKIKKWILKNHTDEHGVCTCETCNCKDE